MVDKDSQKVKNVDVEDVGSEDDDNGFTNSGDFKKKLVKYVFLFCVAVVVVFFAFLLVFKVKVKPIEYVDKLNKNFAELLRETDSVIVIDDNAPSFKIFPYPHFEVNKVKITNLVKDKNTFNGEIGQVNIFLKLEKIFFLKTEIENFTFDKPDLYIKPFLEKKIRESDTDIVGDDLVANTSIEEPNEPIDLGDTTETIEEPATIEKTEETKEKKTEYGNTDFLKMFFDKKINIRDGKITVDYSKYSRKIENINSVLEINNDNINYNGSLSSNKQVANIGLNIDYKNEDSKITLKIDSIAFELILKASGKIDSFEGNVNVDMRATQLFSKFIFSDNNLLYNRIIDNEALKVSFDFGKQDDTLSLTNIIFEGNSLNGKGSAEFVFDKQNNVNFIFDNINLDKLVIRSLSRDDIVDHDDVYLFNKDNFVFADNPIPAKTRLSQKFNNPYNINFEVKEVLLNGRKIENVVFDAKYDGKFSLNEFKASIEEKIFVNVDEKHTFKVVAENIAKNDNNPQISLDISGKINLNHYGKFLLEDINFKIDDVVGTSNIEVNFDRGNINFVAVDTQIEKLDITNIPLEKRFSGSLKTKSLLLNTINSNGFYRFNILNIKNGKWEDSNYNFIVAVTNNYLSIYDINLNNQISGDFSLDIRHVVPLLKIKLSAKSFEVKNKINFTNYIFNSPLLDDFNGTIKIDVEDSFFLEQPIKNIAFEADIKNGLITMDKFLFDGFGGSCDLKSSYLDLKMRRKFNVSFSNCSIDTGSALSILTNKQNSISGKIGFGAILYSEGFKYEEFLNNYLFKTQVVGKNIKMNGLNLRELDNELFKIQWDKASLNKINPKEMLFQEEGEFLFERVSGNVNFTKLKGTFDFTTESQLVNGKIVGDFEFLKNNINTKFNSAFVLLAGTVKNMIPLSISINYEGLLGYTLRHSENLEQITEYINLIKENSK